MPFIIPFRQNAGPFATHVFQRRHRGGRASARCARWRHRRHHGQGGECAGDAGEQGTGQQAEQVHDQPRKLARCQADLLEAIASVQNPLRPWRNEPRAIKRRPKSYQLLTRPRHQFQEIPHRERYHAAA